MPSIKVVSSEWIRKRYRRLLLDEWTPKMPEEVLSLLWDEIRESADSIEDSWVESLRPRMGKSNGNAFNQTVIARIREFRGIFPNPNLPPMPKSFSEKTGKLLALAERSWTFLILRTLTKIDEETGLFLDTQSLLFFANLHYLLPSLKNQRCQPEHNCLINAMYLHLFTWGHHPGHMFYLGGQLMDYLGKRRARDRMLLESLRLTSAEDHSYLTVVQDYWSNLIEEGRGKEAREFLASLKGMTLPSHQEEMDRMVRHTEEMILGRSA